MRKEVRSVVIGIVTQQSSIANAVTLTNLGLTDAEVIVISEALRRYGSAITSLNLSGNEITSHGAHVLMTALQSDYVTISLSLLNLSDNQISSEGIISMASALSVMPPLRYLDLCGNGVGVKGADALSKALQCQVKNAPYSAVGHGWDWRWI